MGREDDPALLSGESDDPEFPSQSALELGPSHCPNGRLGQDLGFGGFVFALKLPELLNTNLPTVMQSYGKHLLSLMGPKFGNQLGPMSITKLSPNWACQMDPIYCPKLLLSGLYLGQNRYRKPICRIGL